MNDQFAIPVEYEEQLLIIREKQKKLAAKVILEDKIEFGQIKTLTGLDVAYDSDGTSACAAAVTIDFRSYDVIDEQFEFFTPPLPYIPSFLFERESPGYLAVLKKLKVNPEILIFDGNGILHPFGLGLASQMGIEANLPSIGVAKKLLFGDFNPSIKRGGFSLIKQNDDILGAAFQMLDPPTNPIFVSQGHMIDIYTAVNILREFVYFQKYPSKLPLPLHLADKLSKEKMGQR